MESFYPVYSHILIAAIPQRQSVMDCQLADLSSSRMGAAIVCREPLSVPPKRVLIEPQFDPAFPLSTAEADMGLRRLCQSREVTADGYAPAPPTSQATTDSRAVARVLARAGQFVVGGCSLTSQRQHEWSPSFAQHCRQISFRSLHKYAEHRWRSGAAHVAFDRCHRCGRAKEAGVARFSVAHALNHRAHTNVTPITVGN